jgi:hypothetical protein
LERRLREIDNADLHDGEKQKEEHRCYKGELDDRRAGVRMRAQSFSKAVHEIFSISFNIGHDSESQPFLPADAYDERSRKRSGS